LPEKKQHNKVLITGATKGLGRLLAQYFYESGFQVIGTDLYESNEIPEEVKSFFSDYFAFDLRDLKSIPKFLDTVLGKHDIDIVVNNAGILDFRFLEDYDDDEVIDTINVNLTSVMLIIKNILPHFLKKKYGRIINISSNSAYRGFETGSTYTPTKAGINLLTESFGNELEVMKHKTDFDITINAVCPSRIETEEYLDANPEVQSRQLISGKRIYKEILRFIQNKKNGQIVHLFSSKYKIHYLRQKLFVESVRILFK
jgi:NAD(P)-dependent dehydrogenase (short-subunit alcohol dehydrogenase family)